MPFVVAADTGGTFTDLTAFDSVSGEVRFAKSLTTYGDLVDGLMACVAKAGIDLRQADIIKFGTTLVINTFVQRSGSRTALVTTSGFRDVLEMRRGNRARPFDLAYARHPALVDRELRFEIDERVDAHGAVLRAIDEREVTGLAATLRALKVEAVAVSLVNAYANDGPEQALAAALREALPGVYVTAGTDISREWYEYERTSTAVANAYVGPRLKDYVERLDGALRGAGFDKTFYLMASNGGVASCDRAQRRPVTLVESGPVGGIIGAGAYGQALGLPRLVGFDMGGTTAKCALVEDGHFEVKSPYYVGGADYGFPVRGGVLDIVEVGAGGGSIAEVDDFGRLTVGPQSAGSEPGPICYGRGGTRVTITDANLVLGRIGAGSFLGGEMALDLAAARAGVAGLAGRMGLTGDGAVDEMAAGILALATLTMSSAVRQITIERGVDPRGYAMVAFGGGGPLHSATLARELGIPLVVIPPEPGVFSALGMILSDARVDETETFMRPLVDAAMPELAAVFARMEERIRGEIHAELGDVEICAERRAELRFKGQHHSLWVAAPDGVAPDTLRRGFLDSYLRRYGHVEENSPLEFVGLVVTVTATLGRLSPHQLAKAFTRTGGDVVAGSRSIYFDTIKGRAAAAVYQRTSLPIGFRAPGPAVIEEYGSTTVVGHGDAFEVGVLGEIRITIDQD